MPRPPRRDERRQELLPLLAQAFAALGYRRATTAELARQCGVRENVLYRHWADKTAMFVAALDFVRERTVAVYERELAAEPDPLRAARRLLAHESKHLGELGHYRILFSALADTDTPEIRAALRRLYRGIHAVVRDALRAAARDAGRAAAVDHAAWAVLGLGTIMTIAGELGLLSAARRAAVIRTAGRAAIRGAAAGAADTAS